MTVIVRAARSTATAPATANGSGRLTTRRRQARAQSGKRSPLRQPANPLEPTGDAAGLPVHLPSSPWQASDRQEFPTPESHPRSAPGAARQPQPPPAPLTPASPVAESQP